MLISIYNNHKATYTIVLCKTSTVHVGGQSVAELNSTKVCVHILHCSNSDLFLTQRGLQDDLDSIEFWLRTNQLSLNVGKSHVMLIDSRQKLRDSDLCVSINSRQLSRVPSLKYFVVYIDEHLTWQKHT